MTTWTLGSSDPKFGCVKGKINVTYIYKYIGDIVVNVGIYLGYSPKGTQLFPLNCFWDNLKDYNHLKPQAGYPSATACQVSR